MLKRNGIGIGVTTFPDRKRPCLYVLDENSNVCYRMAYFNNQQAADKFQNLVEHRFLAGIISQEEPDDERE